MSDAKDKKKTQETTVNNELRKTVRECVGMGLVIGIGWAWIIACLWVIG